MNEELIKGLNKDLEKLNSQTSVVQSHFDEESNLIAVTFFGKSESTEILDKQQQEYALSVMGVDQETLDYFRNSSESERDEIKRLSEISKHKAKLRELGVIIE